MSALAAVGLWPGLVLVGLGLWLAHAGWVPRVERRRGPSHLALRAQDWLAQADLVGVRVRTIVLVCLGGGLGGAAVGVLLGGWLLGGPVAAVVGGVVGFLAYPWWLRGRHARHRGQVRRALPDIIERVRDALSSGLTIDRAFDLVAREGPEVLQPLMTDFCASLAHLPFEVAVTDLQQRLADRDFDLVASALLLHNEVGGRQFRACLDQLASSLREMLAIRDRLAAGQARIILSARLVAVAPVGLLVLLRLWSPATGAALAQPAGQVALLVGAAMLAGAYLGMLWLARLPSEERVLVR